MEKSRGRSSCAQIIQTGGTIVSKNGGIIGVSDHGGWAVLVTVARDGTLLDRRRVELVDETLHHHEGQLLPIDRAVALVERVRVSAERHAVLALDAVAMVMPHILGIALRRCPQLPPTIAERIKDYRSRNVADWVMYRKALASAAEARRWPIHWYDAKKVLGLATRRSTSRTSTRNFSKCGGQSGRHGTRITSSRWRRP
ncbi:MAG: hypothetical protein GIX02_08535 [Candidatus Eremiobacteraeota bacterium]|nr:hypothetical protein [Candidatus Eremiobacteraeota bacterium]